MAMILTCKTCEEPATVIFNDDTLACEDCKEARFDDPFRFETEDDLWWPLPARTLPVAA